jgi:hypothetical protein
VRADIHGAKMSENGAMSPQSAGHKRKGSASGANANESATGKKRSRCKFTSCSLSYEHQVTVVYLPFGSWVA